MLVSGRVSQFSGVCHLHSCGPYYQSLVASSEDQFGIRVPPDIFERIHPGHFGPPKHGDMFFFFFKKLFTHMYIYV